MQQRKVHILFDASPLMVQRTGVGHYTSRLIKQLASDHPDIEIIGYYYNFMGRTKRPREPSAPNLSYRAILGVPEPLVNLLRRCHILLPVELLTLRRADFIFYPNYLGLSSLFKTPSTAVIHDLTFVDLPEYVAPRNLHDLKNYVPAQIRRSKFIVTVSEFSKRRISEEFGTVPNDILVTPIPPEPPTPVNPEKEKKILENFGVSGKYILTLGTVEPRKNLPNLLEAYLQLPEKLQQEYTLVIAGKIGWNCDKELALLQKLKKQGRNIIHIGYVDDTQRAALYRHASLFTSASYYEGFGMPVLEAMGFGVPCAISDIPVFREVAGDAALYFNQNKVEYIASALQAILASQARLRELSTAGKNRAKHYEWSKIADDLYNRITQTLQKESGDF